MNNFFTVCKYDKSRYLVQSYYSIKKFYKNIIYSVIVPDYEIDKFEDLLLKNNVLDINLIKESKYLSLNKFKNIYKNLLNDLNLFSEKGADLLPWYFQQVLKLSFCFDNNVDGNIIMIDADTIILKKIKLFDKKKSIIFLSSYERNVFYKYICEDIFKEKYTNWSSSTVQMFVMTTEERKFLQNKFNQYLAISKNQLFGDWIAKIILQSVLLRFKSLYGSFISEQDLIASSNKENGSKKFKKLMFLRSGVIGELNKFQMKVATKLNFHYLTYEKWIMKKEKINNFDFLIIIFINYPLIHKNLKKLQSFLKR